MKLIKDLDKKTTKEDERISNMEEKNLKHQGKIL